ncbi:sugar isomerase domain-containing protein [Abyssisolibacter fermentans]|uniref:sugar isomerase domain-containing protein n=1 Tax=Abyssisolibacter fermentans TaxID=1766203 RepID=UPI00082A64FF|nr:SIS domain-containing protein [Abyssisolibacter fermentans]
MSALSYIEEAQKLINQISITQYDKIIETSKLFVDKIKNKKIIHIFGTGHSHMISEELFDRAGGLANINAMLDDTVTIASGATKGSKLERLSGLAEILWDHYDIEPDDLMIIISNSGRNSVPVQMALKAREEGLKLIVITSLNHAKSCQSRDSSGKKLYELGDIVLDNCVPSGDSLLDFNGKKSGPGSTIAGITILNSIVAEALKTLTEEGFDLPILGSQNVDGTDNDDLYKKYKARIKHL